MTKSVLVVALVCLAKAAFALDLQAHRVGTSLAPENKRAPFAQPLSLRATTLESDTFGLPRGALDKRPALRVANPHASTTAGTPADSPTSRATTLAAISAPAGLTVAVGGPGVDMPWLISPTVRGSGGLQVLLTVHDQPGFRARLGAGWVDMRSTHRVPLLQPGPVRHWNAEGSELAWPTAGGEWYVSVQRRNWGSGWSGSLILDGAAPPLAAIGWRRPTPAPSPSAWLRWMGPWTVDAFIGRLAGHDQPERPALIGFRLQIQPFDGLQLGLSRTMQWGGRGRDESLKSLWRSLLGQDNLGTNGVMRENHPGNQLGGFDWRWQWGADSAHAFYGQLIGEDESGYLPSAYIVQVGLQTRWALGKSEVTGFVEWNDLIAGHAYGSRLPPGITYTSTVYRQGYTHDRMSLGHPAGGDVTLASVGLLSQTATMRWAAVACWGNALPTSQRFAAGSIAGLNASFQLDIQPLQQAGAGLWWWRDSAEQQHAVQLWWRLLF